MSPVRALAALAALFHLAPAAAGEVVYDVRPEVDLPVTAAGFGLAGLLYSQSGLLPHRCPCDSAELNGLDRPYWDRSSDPAARASDVTVAVALSAPLAADTLLLGLGPALGTDVLVYAETLAVDTALYAGVKYVLPRPLPRTYQGDPGLLESDAGYRSFYSGHASTVVSALTAAAWTARWRYGEQVWPWVLAGVGGVSVSAEQVLAGRHFVTDGLVGIAVGFAVGTAVPWLHRAPGDAPVSIAPLSPAGLAIRGRF